MESERDQSRALVNVEPGKPQHREAVLAEGWDFLGDHSSLLRLSHEMFHCEVNRALHNHLRPLFDAFPNIRLLSILYRLVELIRMAKRCTKARPP